MYWKLNRIQYPIYNLGPGTRIGIWVQGCSLKCNGCLSKTLWTTNKGRKIDILFLADQICKIENYFDGITITGGEPFEQYESLIAFCAYIKQKTSLNIFCFSGYYLEELLKMYPDKLFMKHLNYLLDGRYLSEKHENKNVRGSSNQKLYKFINGRPGIQKNFFNSNKWSISIKDNDQIYMSGIPKKEDLKIITHELEKTGIKIRFK